MFGGKTQADALHPIPNKQLSFNTSVYMVNNNNQKGEAMTTESETKQAEQRKPGKTHYRGSSEAVYGFGLIGAWLFYFTHAATFWVGLLGFFKGIVWPAMLVYEALKFLTL
jgi:hypothetical protein